MRTEDIKFSIIVPAYNADKYIDQTIRSIIDQTYKNWEVILVDDGSTDNTSAICDMYSQKDKRVITLHQLNGGTVDAIQNGIQMSSGDFVWIVASDDWVDVKALEIFYDKIEKTGADLISCQIEQHLEGKWNKRGTLIDVSKSYFHSHEDQLVSPNELLNFVFTTNYFSEVRCIRKSIIHYTKEEYTLLHDKKIKFNSDIREMMPIFCNCSKALIISDGLYHYRIRSTSVSHSAISDKEVFQNVFDSMRFAIKSIDAHALLNDKLRDLIDREAMRELYTTMEHVLSRKYKIDENIKDVLKDEYCQNMIKRLTFKKVVSFRLTRNPISNIRIGMIFVRFNKVVINLD